MKSADRTRSKRWRSGTRRTKRHSAHTTIQCASPTYCLVHATVAHPKRPPAMAMRLTRCEQKWVDDVMANRPHTHIKLRRSAVRRSNSIDLLGLIYRSNPGKLIGHEVKAMGGLPPGKHAVRQRPDGTVTITPYGDSKMGHSYHVPPGGVAVGMDYADPNRFTVMGLGRSWGKAAEMEAEVMRQRALGHDVMQVGSSPRMRNI